MSAASIIALLTAVFWPEFALAGKEFSPAFGIVDYSSKSVDVMNKRLGNGLKLSHPYQFGRAYLYSLDSVWRPGESRFYLGADLAYAYEKHVGESELGSNIQSEATSHLLFGLAEFGLQVFPWKVFIAKRGPSSFKNRFFLVVYGQAGLMELYHFNTYVDKLEDTDVRYSVQTDHLVYGPKFRLYFFLGKGTFLFAQASYLVSSKLGAINTTESFRIEGEDVKGKPSGDLSELSSSPYGLARLNLGLTLSL